MEFLSEPELWVGVGFVAILAIIFWQKVPAMVGKALDDRAAAIAAELETAKRLRTEAEALLTQYRKKSNEVEKEAQAILLAAKADAEAFAAESRAQMKVQIERRGAAAQAKIAQAEATAMSEIRAAAADAAVAAAEKLIAERLDEKRSSTLVTESLRDLSAKLN
jgi:F-type H+-transporting ATPase subunit b